MFSPSAPNCMARRLGFLALLCVILTASVIAREATAEAQAAGVHMTVVPQEGPSGSQGLGYALAPSTTEPYATCKPQPAGTAVCLSISPPQGAVPDYEGGGEEKSGLTPSELREAYGIPEKGGSGQTVAIVDAYDDPHANADLEKYRSAYKLPACTESNLCFERVNQEGKKEKYPESNGAWDTEISLDLDMVSAMCGECHIRLVEANSAGESDLFAAENKAAELKGTAGTTTEMSNSWTVNRAGEFSGETVDDTYFNHPGIPITVASGDENNVFYPAASPYVISVGGTVLKKAATSRGWEETVWGDSGDGCSKYETKPAWQADWGCAKRTDNDVGADAEVGISIYDSGWSASGGTSASAPIVAAIEAHASEAVRKESGAEAFYRHSLFDVTLGSTYDECSYTYVCIAEEGYDAPTGWGSPDGPLESSGGYRAITREATGLTKTAASLNGYIDPEGLSTSYQFEYGQTGSYGKTAPVPKGEAGSGVIWKAVVQNLSGLEEDRTYHYRLSATNSSGTIYGQDYTFATIPWTIQSTPTPAGTTEETYYSYLYGLSCSSSTACTGVGWYQNSTNAHVTLADRWNGTEWVVQSTPNPEGGTEDKLQGVSCASSTACIAVGHYTKSGTSMNLAEGWNGSSWTIQSTPAPEGAKGSELLGISCTSSTACTAVGRYYIKEKLFVHEYLMLAERWNGTSWTVQATPSPEGSIESGLQSVWCTSAEACTAVGSVINGAGKTVGLVERWNGKEWTSQEIAGSAALVGVSCSSSEACTAVTGGLAAERWNGKEWTSQTLPNPVGLHESDRYNGAASVHGVACSLATQCVAVGGLHRETEETTAAWIWNGSEWSVQGAPRPANGILYGVSCPSGTSCGAAGSQFGYVQTKGTGFDHFVTLAEGAGLPPTGKPVVETKAATAVTSSAANLNGTVDPEGAETSVYFEYGLEREKYEHKTAEAGAGFYRSKLEVGVAVTGLTLGTTYHFRIVAVNAYGTTYGEDKTFTAPLWSSQSLPSPSGAKWSAPRKLSCVSGSACEAVGAYDNSSGIEAPLAGKWNGTEWSLQSAPNPAGAKWSALAGVSCTSSSACTAVGRYDNSSGVEVTLAERWNGTEWLVQSTPNPSGAKSSWLEDVSCSSSSACTSVGRYENSSKVEVTLAEHWNGSEWSVQTTPNPSGAIWSRLADVSCTSSTACEAVGSYENSAGTRVTLAERGNGGEWTVQATTNPAGSEWNALKGVSCTGASECTAVGGYRMSSKYVTLAEHWNGAEWTVQATPEPNRGELLDVSCPSSSWCAATGTNEASEPLAEHWDGGEWTIQPASLPTSGSVSALEGVSCATTCLSVGYTEEAKIPSPLAESYPLRPPYTKTEPATGVSETQATLDGLVNPSGAETKYWFEYGPSTSYGSKTSEVGVGSGMSNMEESKTITGLTGGATYHYRVVATNSLGTTFGKDVTFAAGIPGALNGMVVTDPFNGTNSAVSNFAGNWPALGWASEKGLDQSTGWGPTAAYPTIAGAYYAPTIADVGTGIADVVTMSASPELENRYFSIWLDMSSPGSTRSGYEATFTDLSAGTYEVKLSKWASGTQTALASKPSYGFANGDSVALVDRGGSVSVWTNVGSGFGELLSAGDTTFEGGAAAVEGAGSITRLTNFKVGELLSPVSSTSAALEALAVNDAFATSESPLSDGGAFAALAWDNGGAEHNTGRVEGGWGPYDAYSTIDGAYWHKTSFADTGAGDAVAAKLAHNPENENRYCALWLNMPNPGSVRSGYELRFKETASGIYEVVLAKWVAGTETVLASKTGYAFAVGSLFALAQNGGTVSAWTKTGSEYTQLLSASDASFMSGYTGIEGSGNITRLTEYRGGPLPPT
jgi:hypothetical protein